MIDPEPMPPRLPASAEGEIIDIPGPPVESLPLDTSLPLEKQRDRQYELERLRLRHALELARINEEAKEHAHERRKEVIDRVAGHLLRALVIVGGVALFPLHFPVVGGLLLGAGLDLLTKSELRRILKGAIKAYMTKGSDDEPE